MFCKIRQYYKFITHIILSQVAFVSSEHHNICFYIFYWQAIIGVSQCHTIKVPIRCMKFNNIQHFISHNNIIPTSYWCVTNIIFWYTWPQRVGIRGKLRRASKRTELFGRKKINKKILRRKKNHEFYGAPTLV